MNIKIFLCQLWHLVRRACEKDEASFFDTILHTPIKNNNCDTVLNQKGKKQSKIITITIHEIRKLRT